MAFFFTAWHIPDLLVLIIQVVAMANTYETLETRIRTIERRCDDSEAMTLQNIVSLLGHSSNYLIILFLIIPFLQPIPLLGLSTFCGILIVISGGFSIFNRPFYLPKWAKRQTISQITVRKTCYCMLKLFDKTQRWVHERGRFVRRHTLLRWLNGLLICVLGLLLALPLPIPFTNTLPAISLAALCLGTLRDDGMILGCGWLLTAVTCVYFSTVITIPFRLIGWAI
jgi:hypothetical protein